MSLFDYFTGFDRANYEAGQRADAARQALLDERADRLAREEGAAAAEKFRRELEANRQTYGTLGDGTNRDPDEAIGEAFLEGLSDGRQNIRRTIGGTINGVLQNVFGLVPWQVWLAAALYLVWHLGWAKKLLSKAAAR